MTRPLSSFKVIEFAGLGPTPFTAMMLADLGADVLRVERPAIRQSFFANHRSNYLNRGRPSIILDLKSADGLCLARDLCLRADILVEGFRPGVMERLGLGPLDLMKDNPALIYARMTGWGQDGPLAHKAGHDINYLSLMGVLSMLGSPDQPPPPPLNVVGDYGGGGMFNVVGILAALIERSLSGLGQVVDTAMLDGSSVLLTQILAWKQMGMWHPERESNLLDGGAYFYRCYETRDNKYMAVGALEQEFHDELVTALGLTLADFDDCLNRSLWPERRARFAEIFRTKTQDQWCEVLKPYDTCTTPVLTLDEALLHPANVVRKVYYTDSSGQTQPAPAPRLSRTPAQPGPPPQLAGEGGAQRLSEWGVDGALVSKLIEKQILEAN